MSTSSPDRTTIATGGVRPMPQGVAVAWIAAALVALVLVTIAFDATVPLVSVVLLVVALAVLRRRRTPAALGMTLVPARQLFAATGAATVAMVLLFGLAEVAFHPYRELLEIVEGEEHLDSTFAWVIELDGFVALLGFAAYSGLVTMFAEEVVFRGALLSALRPRGPVVAIGVSAATFVVLQALPATQLSFAAAFGFVVVDALLALGLVGGAAAWTTASIWPGLIAVTVANVVVVVAVT